MHFCETLASTLGKTHAAEWKLKIELSENRGRVDPRPSGVEAEWNQGLVGPMSSGTEAESNQGQVVPRLSQMEK